MRGYYCINYLFSSEVIAVEHKFSSKSLSFTIQGLTLISKVKTHRDRADGFFLHLMQKASCKGENVESVVLTILHKCP